MARSKGSGGGKYRSVISGRYVIAAHGRRSPRTTVREQGPQFLSCPYPAKSLRHRGWWVAHSVRKAKGAGRTPGPVIYLRAEDHPLAREQKSGITMARVHEILESTMPQLFPRAGER